jgi:very-short-patch-repair endonuclease
MPSPDHRTLRDVHTPWPERTAATASASAEHSRERARELRQSMSPPEVLLWQQLRARQVLDLKFRRQHVLGPYFADFYCHELKLIVEVDGHWEHRARREQDATRDRWMSDRGYHVLRISASQVCTCAVTAAGLVARKAIEINPKLAERLPPSSPQGRGGSPKG